MNILLSWFITYPSQFGFPFFFYYTTLSIHGKIKKEIIRRRINQRFLKTEEDTVTYVMDFPDDVYVTVTDDNGRTPVRAKQNLVLACYDSEGRYRWGSEFKTFMELQKICQAQLAGSPELLQALKDASKTLKDGE